MPWGWEDNHRSGVALAMRHGLKWFMHLRAQRPRVGDEHPAYVPAGAWLPLLLLFCTDGLMSQLQSVHNAAAHLVSGARCYDHITPVLKELHLLPIHHRVDFKMATLVYLSLSGMAPSYLVAHCQLVTDDGRRQLHSANSRTCVVRRTCSSYGDRCFAAAGPRLWNSLPGHLRQTGINFEQFSWLLKTFLFSCWERGVLWLSVEFVPSKSFYLLIYTLSTDRASLSMYALSQRKPSQKVKLWPLHFARYCSSIVNMRWAKL